MIKNGVSGVTVRYRLKYYCQTEFQPKSSFLLLLLLKVSRPSKCLCVPVSRTYLRKVPICTSGLTLSRSIYTSLHTTITLFIFRKGFCVSFPRNTISQEHLFERLSVDLKVSFILVNHRKSLFYINFVQETVFSVLREHMRVCLVLKETESY